MDALLTPSPAPAQTLPCGRPVISMQWHNLLLAHWPIRAELLRPLIPSELEIDAFDGWAWIGVVPFYLTIRYRWMPRGLSFPEVNVRTYVKRGDQGGVWFLSLDAHHRLAVTAARNRFALPYHFARMKMDTSTGAADYASAAGNLPKHWQSQWQPKDVQFSSERRSTKNGAAVLGLSYHPAGEIFLAQPGTLDHFLTERYRLFTADRKGRIGVGEIDHAPWRLQPASAEFKVNSMLEPLGLVTTVEKPLLHFSRFVDAVAWKVCWLTLA